jgi:uncharacterized protein YcbK (DUF882 family)
MSLVSAHFDIDEFACHDGTPYPEEWVDARLQPLCDTLEAVRDRWGGPLIIVSGYRTGLYNQRIQGASLSQHVEGRAVDVRPKRGESVRALYELTQQLLGEDKLPHLGGLGVYPRWVHIDVRPRKADGRIAKWSGYGLGSEQTT